MSHAFSRRRRPVACLVIVLVASLAGLVLALGAPVVARAATTFAVATARAEITPGVLGFPDYYRAGYGSNGPVHVTGGSPLYAPAC